MKATNSLLLQYEQSLKTELENGKDSYNRDIVSDQHPIAQAEKQLDPQAEDESSSIDISSLHLNQTKSGHKTSVEANDEDFSEENEVKYTTTFSSSQEEENDELWSSLPLDEQLPQDEMHTEEQETGQEDQVLQTNVSDAGEGVEADVGKEDASDEEQPPSDNEDLGAFHQTSKETHPQSSMAERTAVFSPAASPQPGSTDTKSPAFLFSLHSDPSIPGFSGFGFDMGMSQEE
ncbi:hypothetical protein F7725_001954, partial [Dissostichus mawsoni]